MTKRKGKGGTESIAEGIIREAGLEAAAEVERRRVQTAVRAREQVAILGKRCRDLEAKLADFAHVQSMIDALTENPLERFEIKQRERGRGKGKRVHEATAVLMLSDLHFEEIVDPVEVNGLNEFNLEIASQRMDRLAVGLVWLLELSRSEGRDTGYVIRELFLPCLGDVITNYLRAEDMQGNFLTPFEAIVFAQGLLVRFVKTILARCPWLERIYMPIIPGNHDRLSFTNKTQFRKRVGMSNAPVLAHGLQIELRDEPRVIIKLAGAEHHYTTIYDHAIRGMHGDRFNYNSGVGGIFIPARRHVAALNKLVRAALTLFGHWHTSKEDDDWVSNGSLIGLNTYSMAKGLDPEPPSQTFLLLDKDRGKRLCTPVQVGDRVEWS